MSRLVGHDIRGILRVFELQFALGIEANLGLISYMVWKRSNRLGSRLTQSVGAIVPNVSGTLGSRLARVPFAVGDCMFVAGRTLLEAREPRQVMVDPTSSALSRLQARLRVYVPEVRRQRIPTCAMRSRVAGPSQPLLRRLAWGAPRLP